MKKYWNLVVSLTIVVTMVFSFSSVAFASDTTNNTAMQNPYVAAYLNEAAQEAVPQNTDNLDGSNETIASLNIYYQKDLELSTLLGEYAPADFELSLVCSIEKDDKISAMHMMQSIYNQVENTECKKLIDDYFRRYATHSGDTQAIAFYNNIFDYEQSRNAIMSEISTVGIAAKQQLEEALDSRVETRATTAYDDNFSPSSAGQWAYDNYNLYNSNFPAFNNGFGSDCANFVSQALYFGGMEMHDTWYCHKKNNEYPRPASAAQLDYSWTLEDPSPWISVEEFVSFWSSKTDDYYEYTKSEYTENHSDILNKPITKGDVIILCNNTLWWSTPSHAMIVSAYDFTDRDYLCAGHSNMRRDLPLVTAVSGYDSVRIYCF